MTDIINHCSCGRAHTREQWSALEYCGVMDLDGSQPLELRNCVCGSTRAIEIEHRQEMGR